MAVLAVDWSGRASGAARHIWIGEAIDGVLVGLEAGRTREQVADHLVERAGRDDELVVGFDFSFSLPTWFLDEHGYASAPELWEAATQHGEAWLRGCQPPFWGRRGRPRPELPEHLRLTERAVAAVGGVRPKSTFQIGGAGSVGTGSVRGFPLLARLRRAGFTIWPMDRPVRSPLVVEIYPRALTGPVVKSSPDARRAYLDRHLPDLGAALREQAAASEDGFDAAVSAVVMSRHRDQLWALPQPSDVAVRREGWVWEPELGATTPMPSGDGPATS